MLYWWPITLKLGRRKDGRIGKIHVLSFDDGLLFISHGAMHLIPPKYSNINAGLYLAATKNIYLYIILSI